MMEIEEICESPLSEELVRWQTGRVLAMIERDEARRRPLAPAALDNVATRRRACLALAARNGASVICVLILPH